MKSTGTERDWLRAAEVPPPEFTAKGTCGRDDLFRELDYLVADLGAADKLLDSRVRRRVTRIRALASTLIPKPPTPFRCADCRGLEFKSRSALITHLELLGHKEDA